MSRSESRTLPSRRSMRSDNGTCTISLGSQRTSILLSFYDLESMLMPVTNHSPTPTISHKSWGSCLDIEDDEGIEELGEDDAATWLDEKVGTHHPHKMCFEMEQEIDLNAAVVMGPLAEAQKPLVIDATDLIDVDAAPAKAEQDLDTAWDW
ncbi:hypothetical protein PAXINDRAFT_103404 [Paxillus involutus ATCC 200175]|uniref:Uncharacterized protein n=1 Tax=Paxillus involutus ATCC 200175 TaxID=664439 RepID=A0A0C9T4M9_PAXIN|nr:hypothetical protein PAXINDRAFT_103404 [Paxillus involutus ATCC 200175]